MWGLVMASGHATAIGGLPEHVPIGNGLLRPPLAGYSQLLANCGLLVMAATGCRWPESTAAGQAGGATESVKGATRPAASLRSEGMWHEGQS